VKMTSMLLVMSHAVSVLQIIYEA